MTVDTGKLLLVQQGVGQRDDKKFWCWPLVAAKSQWSSIFSKSAADGPPLWWCEDDNERELISEFEQSSIAVVKSNNWIDPMKKKNKTLSWNCSTNHYHDQ